MWLYCSSPQQDPRSRFEKPIAQRVDNDRNGRKLRGPRRTGGSESDRLRCSGVRTRRRLPRSSSSLRTVTAAFDGEGLGHVIVGPPTCIPVIRSRISF